ncbi:nucleotide phosphodiesterase [Clostridioides difficile]|nr:nucleotide phosphodiesterase [Clostridioides difficile]
METSEGNVKVGILGLTIKEVGKGLKNVNLQEQFQYKDKLYANDLVEDAKKWIKVMEKEKNRYNSCSCTFRRRTKTSKTSRK